MRSPDPVWQVVLLEELDRGGMLVETADGALAVVREPRGMRLVCLPGNGQLPWASKCRSWVGCGCTGWGR